MQLVRWWFLYKINTDMNTNHWLTTDIGISWLAGLFILYSKALTGIIGLTCQWRLAEYTAELVITLLSYQRCLCCITVGCWQSVGTAMLGRAHAWAVIVAVSYWPQDCPQIAARPNGLFTCWSHLSSCTVWLMGNGHCWSTGRSMWLRPE